MPRQQQLPRRNRRSRGGDAGATGEDGGTTSAGGNGSSTGGASSTTGETGDTGEGGSAGEGEPASSNDAPSLGDPCDTNGALACNGAAQKLRLICDAGQWKNNGSCSADENCEQTSGVCAPIDDNCDGLDPGDTYCDANSVRKCNADFVTSPVTEECTAACRVYQGQGQCVWVTQVATGRHTCAVLNTGQLRCWGNNARGQLGLGNTEPLGDQQFEMPPPDVPLDEPVTSVAVASGHHTCAILASGHVRCWGANSAGELGLGSTETIGDNELATQNVNLEESATQVAVGEDFSCALLASGAVRCWGNAYRTGIPNAVSNIGDDESPTENVHLGAKAVQLTAGVQHTCALLETGAVRCWGVYTAGQLGIPEAPNLDRTTILTIDVNVGGKAEFIAASGYSTCAILENLQPWAVKCWGENVYYQLGNGSAQFVGRDAGTMPPSYTNVGATVTQVGVSTFNGCALTSSGVVRCWGLADYAGYALDGAITNELRDATIPKAGGLPPGDVALGGEATSLAVGIFASCAIMKGGTLRCWGNNQDGQLGYGPTVPFVGDDETPADVGDVPVF